jgi:uncharacterized protein with HEPN domain
MIDAAKETLSFVSGKSKSNLINDRMLVLAIVKDIEIIGEAAGKVSKETRDAHNTIPWQDIIDMRNRLIHAYYDVDIDIVWNTINKDLSPLKATLEKIVQQEGN